MLVKLNLKKYSLPKTYVRNGEQCLLDPIRKKLVLKTPEEIVRQKIVCFLQDKMKIPKDKIELEIPMKYYKKRARGRADIIVSAYTENNKFIPVFLVECKAPNVSLTDKVFQQVRKYDEIIYANTVAITNGKYFIIKSWDQETKIYRDLEELPTYKDLVNKKDLVFDKTEYNPWKRPEFKDKYDDCTIKEFIDYQWIGVDTPKKLYPFLINLAGCIQDDTEKLKPQIINGIKIIKDGGIRYTEYGNAGGGRLTGLYRYFIIEDDEGNNQIISMTTMGLPSLKDHPTFGNQRGKTTLIVAIDDLCLSRQNYIEWPYKNT